MTLFPDPPPEPTASSEAAIRDAVIGHLNATHGDILSWLRRELIKVFRFRLEDVGREAAYVTADDARAKLGRCPYTVPECKNFLGALFKTKGWRAVGFHTSATPGSHGNRLMRWVYEGPLTDGGPYGREPKDTQPKC